MEEVVIGAEHGTTFPTQIGITVCHALIDTGATGVVLVRNTIKVYH